MDVLLQFGSRYASLRQGLQDKLIVQRQYINEHGMPMPEVRD